MPFHVRLTTHSQPGRDELKLDLSRQELEVRFLTPYREGRPIVIGGRTVSLSDVRRIRIHETEQASEALLPLVRAERARSRALTTMSDEWYVAGQGQDVTDQLITEPPGAVSTRSPASEQENMNMSAPDTKAVFVVHGRNLAARDAVFDFLRSLALHPIEFNEARLGTGKPSPYIGDILSYALSAAQAIVVLMTPDDEAQLRTPFRSPSDPPHETSLTGQARANVLFEAGMAMGRSEDRTVLVQMGELRPFSDIGGRHALRMDDSSERRQEFAQRLQSAGCDVNMNGTDWHKAGAFASAV